MDTNYRKISSLCQHTEGIGFSRTLFPVVTPPYSLFSILEVLAKQHHRPPLGAMPRNAHKTKSSHIPFVQKDIFGARIGRAKPAGLCPKLSKNQSLSSKFQPIEPEHEGLRFTLTQRQACGYPWETTDKGTGSTQRERRAAKSKITEMRMQSEAVGEWVWEAAGRCF